MNVFDRFFSGMDVIKTGPVVNLLSNVIFYTSFVAVLLNILLVLNYFVGGVDLCASLSPIYQWLSLPYPRVYTGNAVQVFCFYESGERIVFLLFMVPFVALCIALCLVNVSKGPHKAVQILLFFSVFAVCGLRCCIKAVSSKAFIIE